MGATNQAPKKCSNTGYISLFINRITLVISFSSLSRGQVNPDSRLGFDYYRVSLIRFV
ncbi:hypothetical protein HanPI659440_Chr08g0295751 [Helianthus annuus]|nr:hypothetical protein HanPI659440_Chr08g0295751 [Helianthus annuus]